MRRVLHELDIRSDCELLGQIYAIKEFHRVLIAESRAEGVAVGPPPVETERQQAALRYHVVADPGADRRLHERAAVIGEPAPHEGHPPLSQVAHEGEGGTPALRHVSLFAAIRVPQSDVGIVEIDAAVPGRPADLYAGEILVVTEERIYLAERTFWIRVGIGQTGEQIKVLAEHGAAGNAEGRVVGQRNGRSAGAEGEIHEARPRARQGKGVHVIRGIEKAGGYRRPAAGETLAPVEVGDPEALIAERWLEDAHVADAGCEGVGRDVAVAVPVLDLPDEGAGIGSAPAQQIPVAEGADHAA